MDKEKKIKEMLELKESIYRSKSWKIRKQKEKQLKSMEKEYFMEIERTCNNSSKREGE